MAFYGDVTPGEEFRPSAALSNDIRHFLNGLNGFGGNPFGANGAGTVRIQAYNATGGEIRAGTAVNFDESKRMSGDAVPMKALLPYELIIPSRESRRQEILDWFAQADEQAAPTIRFRIAHMLNAYELTEQGVEKAEKFFDVENLSDPENNELYHHIIQALKANAIMKRDVDYVVQDNQVMIVDEFTGRIMVGRRFSDGLHQALEAKEHVKVERESRTLATITYQNFFRMYDKLSGMTGTAKTEEAEFQGIYRLDVVVIPTNRPMIRKDLNDMIYTTKKGKYKAVVEEIIRRHATGQPVLVGTISVEVSELLSHMLEMNGVEHEVLNAKHHAREAAIVAQAGHYGAVTIATNMAGRGTDIMLGGNAEYLAREDLRKAGYEDAVIAEATGYAETDNEEILAARALFAERMAAHKQVTNAEAEKVRAAGGLFILGTERHESRRIDNQLRGRSGRQGDPGRSRFYISMDDDLMRLFGGDRMKNIMSRIGMQPGEPIYHPWLTKGIERAQKKVEERNFEIRKNLIDYDDVLNEQREYIYEQRDGILADDNLSERVMATASDYLDLWFDEYEHARRNKEALAALSENIRNNFGVQLPPEQLNKDAVMALLQNDITEKTTLAGHQNFNMFIRYQYIQMIDRRWLDQLEFLDGLREAVHLRSYGSKNPLTEYKIDGFNQFDDMLEQIRLTIAGRVFKVRIQINPAPIHQRQINQQAQAQHAEAASMSAQAGAARAAQQAQAAASRTMAGASTGKSVTVMRTMPKVGRNDPCPCGSGKKYKLCHGR